MCRAGVCFNLSLIRNDYHNIWPSPFLLEHQNRWTGCQPRVHERPRGHSRRGNVSNLNILIQPTAADTRRSINLSLKLGQRRRRWTNVKPTLIQRLVSAGRPIPYQTQDIDPKSKMYYITSKGSPPGISFPCCCNSYNCTTLTVAGPPRCGAISVLVRETSIAWCWDN